MCCTRKDCWTREEEAPRRSRADGANRAKRREEEARRAKVEREEKLLTDRTLWRQGRQETHRAPQRGRRGGRPRPATGGAQEGSERQWWRRVFGG